MRDEFLKWLGTKPSGQAHEFAWEAWKAATLLKQKADYDQGWKDGYKHGAWTNGVETYAKEMKKS